mmetsp:Transcript_48710/g.115014  ORF Transcript_48710/g.115014 Transcript_48710/m.115014 type:complete len:227 (+) Transcript_48710:672-1352(+)
MRQQTQRQQPLLAPQHLPLPLILLPQLHRHVDEDGRVPTAPAAVHVADRVVPRVRDQQARPRTNDGAAHRVAELGQACCAILVPDAPRLALPAARAVEIDGACPALVRGSAGAGRSHAVVGHIVGVGAVRAEGRVLSDADGFVAETVGERPAASLRRVPPRRAGGPAGDALELLGGHVDAANARVEAVHHQHPAPLLRHRHRRREVQNRSSDTVPSGDEDLAIQVA